MVSDWFSCVFRVIFLWSSCHFRVDFLWFSHGFRVFFEWCSYGFCMVSLWFSYVFRMVFLWFPFGALMILWEAGVESTWCYRPRGVAKKCVEHVLLVSWLLKDLLVFPTAPEPKPNPPTPNHRGELLAPCRLPPGRMVWDPPPRGAGQAQGALI